MEMPYDLISIYILCWSVLHVDTNDERITA